MIGILSDSHGRAAITGAAVACLKDAGAQTLIHLGDIETEAVLDELVGHDAHIVFGNCDLDERTLTRYANNVDIAVHHPLGELIVHDRRIVFTHGHLTRLVQSAMAEAPDYLLHGHTHETRDERVDSTRVINPGALFRASRYTVAILDPGPDVLEFIEVSPPPAR